MPGTSRRPARAHERPAERERLGRTALPLPWIWLAAFAYALLAGVLVQLVLPHVAPGWHRRDGLLVGGDWLAFHGIASGLARRIADQGWSAWELRPRGQAPAGIAGAIYALTVPKPWTMLPLNAAVHATAALVLVRLLGRVTGDRRLALAGALPFLLYPTALVWVTQIHKDGFAILGYYLALDGCLGAGREALEARAWGRVALRGLEAVAGAALVWVVRPFSPAMGAAAFLLVAAVLWGARLVRARGARRTVALAGLAACLAVALLAAGRGAALHGVPGTPDPHVPRDVMAHWQGGRGVIAPQRLPQSRYRLVPEWIPWLRTPGLPLAVEWAGYRIALTREAYRYNYHESQSNLDRYVAFRSVGEVVRHVPRALQVGVWAPFPWQWVEAGSSRWTTVGRRVAGAEMLGVYLATLGLPVAAWAWRRRLELWILLLVTLAPIVMFALMIPNVGALHRLRYGPLMLLVALGVAGLGALRAGRAATSRLGPAGMA
jgi:hypothetical protein